jgi:hypothetical protein
MSTLGIRNCLVTLMLSMLACFGSVQAQGLRVYPSWENPRFVFQGGTLPFCRPVIALAQNQNGVLRIYVSPQRACPPAFGTTPPMNFLVDRIFDLRKICVTNGNCEATANNVEWFERERAFEGVCGLPNAPAECLPVAPNDPNFVPPFLQRTTDLSPIFPHPAQGGFVSSNESREIAIGQRRGGTTVSGVSVQFSAWNSLINADGQKVGIALNREQFPNVTQEFVHSSRIATFNSTAPRFSEYTSLAVRPDTIVLLLDQETTLLDSRSSLRIQSSTNYLGSIYPNWPWNEQGVFDVSDSQLPMRQFKIANCAPETTNATTLTCLLNFDNGTNGKLSVNADNRFVFSYSDCGGPKQIVLALDGAGYSEWYTEDLGPDPFAGTVNALKRGQVRVKLLATRRENAFNLTPGPVLVCAKPIWSCRYFPGPWCN